MVLQGDEEGFAPPFDSSLYGASYSPDGPGTEQIIEYEGCDAVGAYFRTTDDIVEVLPEGVEPYSNPPLAGVMVARYPFSTLGEYNEYFSLVQVEDTNGEMAYYIPYIYVTNDAAMASGREMAGAPKKMAEIGIDDDLDTYQGSLERPSGRRLATLTVKPEQRGTMGLMDRFMPSPTSLLSVRHMPPIEGDDGLTQLVEWYADIEFHEDKNGERKLWRGPVELTYDSPSGIDPVHNLSVDDVMLGTYAKFDMELGVTRVQKEW